MNKEKCNGVKLQLQIYMGMMAPIGMVEIRLGLSPCDPLIDIKVEDEGAWVPAFYRRLNYAVLKWVESNKQKSQ